SNRRAVGWVVVGMLGRVDVGLADLASRVPSLAASQRLARPGWSVYRLRLLSASVGDGLASSAHSLDSRGNGPSPRHLDRALPGGWPDAVDWSALLQPLLVELLVLSGDGQSKAVAVGTSSRAAVEHPAGLCLRLGDLLRGGAGFDCAAGFDQPALGPEEFLPFRGCRLSVVHSRRRPGAGAGGAVAKTFSSSNADRNKRGPRSGCRRIAKARLDALPSLSP